ncbi:MAG: ABC transporter ATP-binding protein [Aigarchaeota archaeon]|nr:ABC transporter ATP-binding protein [Aigarchaeota archaeon]MDW8093109.1 ABC transporter ATP-binding protein [Nitrososphaerota archaeon]
MSDVIRVESLVKVYGDNSRVGPISLTVKKSEVYGLVGPNGSGKTTTIRAILGLLRPTSGKVSVLGRNPFNNPAEVNALIGYSPEVPIFPPFFSARKLLEVNCKLGGLSRREAECRISEVLDLTGLVEHADRKIGNFSKGMVQRLSIGQALIADPEILLLDEPMLGVDPIGRVKIRDVVLELKRRGKTVLFSSHELYEVERLSDRMGMVYMGKMVLEGGVDELLSRYEMGSRVLATVKRDLDPGVIDSLKSIDGVLSVNVEGRRLTIGIDGANNPSDKIAEVLVTSGCGLEELRPLNPSLEDVFVKVVKGDVNR